MSFSSQVKAEIAGRCGTARHCQIAELAAITALCGKISVSGDGTFFLQIITENENVVRKCFTLLKKTFNINICKQGDIDFFKKGSSYCIPIEDSSMAERILMALKLLSHGRLTTPKGLVAPMLIQLPCCKRAFIRGAFLTAGSVSDPNKFYHFEIVCDLPLQACQVRDVINFFGADAKVIRRKKYYVVYVKEGTQIVDLLNVMEAHLALMDLENVRILKEMRNSVNRQVNCETANLKKTVAAGVRQMEDIAYIKDTVGLDILSPALLETALVRLENPDMNLKDLGLALNPPIGKSGVNHRLRKISEIAESLKGKNENLQ